MTPQQRMESTLAKTGIPAKEIKCFGSQILITAYCRDSADRWAAVIGRFARVRGPVESVDYVKVNRGTCLLPTTVKVWRVGGAIL